MMACTTLPSYGFSVFLEVYIEVSNFLLLSCYTDMSDAVKQQRHTYNMMRKQYSKNNFNLDEKHVK